MLKQVQHDVYRSEQYLTQPIDKPNEKFQTQIIT